MTHMKLSELTPGKSIDRGDYLLQFSQIDRAKNGQTYLAGILTDQSGSMEFRYWNYTGDPYPDGSVVSIKGEVKTYKSKLNLILTEIQRSDPNADLSEVIPVAPIDKDDYKNKLVVLLDSIRDSDYRSITTRFWERYQNTILDIPAAKSVHHAYRHGLLMHTVNIMQAADSLCPLYPHLNRDLLIAAAFLHDIGKLLGEFELTQIGLVSDLSKEGLLMGHLISGSFAVQSACQELQVPSDKALALVHCILAHHGLPEYGAAVCPALPEAELLYRLDDMDAKMEIFRTTLDPMPRNSISQRVPFLTNRRICKL